MPDPGNVQAYNRYLYALGNPIRYNDPSGHMGQCAAVALGDPYTSALAGACELAIEATEVYGPSVLELAADLATQWGDKVYAMGNWLLSDPSSAEQAGHSAGQNNAGNSEPGNPQDPFGFNRFTRLARDKGFESLQRDLQSSNAGNRAGAERVLNVMNKLGDQVQRLGVTEKVPGVKTSDIDILDTAGNVHEVGAHTAAQLGQKFQYAQAWIAQSANPNAKIFYWHFGELTQDIIDTAQRWGVEVKVVQ